MIFSMNHPAGCADHCPFLNRRERRCGQHLSLQGLDYAFDYCFGSYQSCPAYFELLVERQARRGRQNVQALRASASQIVQLTVHANAA